MYILETEGVIIRVAPDYLETESEPEESRYIWSYTVEIENSSTGPVQLMTREWRITDAKGRTRVVKGDGVIGEKPVIAPGECFPLYVGRAIAHPVGFHERPVRDAPRRWRPVQRCHSLFRAGQPFHAGNAALGSRPVRLPAGRPKREHLYPNRHLHIGRAAGSAWRRHAGACHYRSQCRCGVRPRLFSALPCCAGSWAGSWR